MSRSVSAPSSVTKTSPCWKGDIVPGSTFRYGSNFMMLTLIPRLSSRQPIEAAASPLPSEDTTPQSQRCTSLASLPRFKLSLEICAGGVHNQLWQKTPVEEMEEI